MKLMLIFLLNIFILKDCIYHFQKIYMFSKVNFVDLLDNPSIGKNNGIVAENMLLIHYQVPMNKCSLFLVLSLVL